MQIFTPLIDHKLHSALIVSPNLEPKFARTATEDLSFQGEPLLRGRHSIHPYPAMLHPLLVEHLLKKFGMSGMHVLDPFCGSGVTLLTSAYLGYSSTGFDINPLALSLARVKTTQYEKEILKLEFKDLVNELDSSTALDIPYIKNLEYWYTPECIEQLGRIRAVLLNANYLYRDFFAVNFAFICRNQSLTRNGEFKRYRLPIAKIDSFKCEAIAKFLSRTRQFIELFTHPSSQPKLESFQYLVNTEEVDCSNSNFDLVLTSPPYGDSGTTVAYGQYSSFALEWTQDLLPFTANYRVDNESLGKRGHIHSELGNFALLKEVINQIKLENLKRSRDVINYFNGYYKALINIVISVKSGGTVCFIVGNRTVCGVQIPLDQITAFMLENLGLRFHSIQTRRITNKVMPMANSPSNISGKKGKTMTSEYIVVFKKMS